MSEIQKAGQALENIVGSDGVRIDEPMKNHTTFRIGGPADLFVTPHSEEELLNVLPFLKKEQIPYFIMGNGSNLLVSDEGFRGVVICLAAAMTDICVSDHTIGALAGARLAAIASRAQQASLTGLEFAAGIPGTLGGACVMNAGAYGGEMKQVLTKVRCIDRDGHIRTYLPEQMELGYRSSTFMRDHLTVVSAEMTLEDGNQDEISARMADLRQRRQSKQPLEYPSAGSTFKRPEGYFAGKLIMDAGLRGFSVGDAQVSEKHCGFVINKGNATAADVWELIAEVRKRVKDQFGVELQPEVRFLGFREEMV